MEARFLSSLRSERCSALDCSKIAPGWTISQGRCPWETSEERSTVNEKFKFVKYIRVGVHGRMSFMC